MIKLVSEILKLEWRATKLVLLLQWKIAKLVLKAYLVCLFAVLCLSIGSGYSETWGWFIFLAGLFLVPRYDKKREPDKNVILS